MVYLILEAINYYYYCIFFIFCMVCIVFIFRSIHSFFNKVVTSSTSSLVSQSVSESVS